MPREIPSPGSFQTVFDSQNDPRVAGLLETLRRECKLDERVRKILATTPELSNEEKTAFDLEKVGKAAARPVVTPIDTPHARVELHEINGHLVYYIQPKAEVPLDVFVEQVIKPALGPLWEKFGIRGWLEAYAEGDRAEIWGVQIRELTLNGLNDSFFKSLLPKAFSDQIGKLLAA